MTKNMTTASVIADSVSPSGHRLTTIEVTMHRFVLAEFNTHRVFSRNSASSRAIPLDKQIERVEQYLAYPVKWATEQKGMQGGEEATDDTISFAEQVWEQASQDAIRHARRLQKLGIHKSIINRLLEPFLWHTVIVTSEEWDNFFMQRCSELAQPEIRRAADAMRFVYGRSTPKQLDWGQWHTPYISDSEEVSFPIDWRLKISAARCARVSYLTHDGKRDPQADLELFDRLVSARPGHWSPLEHVASPASPQSYYGNFPNWVQLRHQYEYLEVDGK